MALARVDDMRFDTAEGPRVIVVVTPLVEIRVSMAQLADFRSQGRTGIPLDEEVLEAARRRSGQDQIVLVRGKGEGGGSWAFDDGMSQQEQEELGYQLVHDQLPTYRRLVAAGVYALMHVDWGAAECHAYTEATKRLLLELEESSIPEFSAPDAEHAAIDRVDRWILKHLTFFFAEPLEAVFERVLSTQLPKLESRVPHLREMVNSLPASAIG
jgi:hypothetical protein